MLASALQFTKTNPKRARANTVIGYAWNEHDEGGWLCPTIKVDSKETGTPLKNADGTFQIDDARVKALGKLMADYKSGY